MPRPRKREYGPSTRCDCLECRTGHDASPSYSLAAAQQQPPPKCLILIVEGAIAAVDGDINEALEPGEGWARVLPNSLDATPTPHLGDELRVEMRSGWIMKA